MKTLHLTDTTEDIRTAADILSNGGLVAMPTETVYGLAADALNGSAVKRIFEAKGRPMDNPLIVHVARFEDISRLGLVSEIPEKALLLAERFWPGPLTIIMPKGKVIPDEVSAGLDTVAVRIPSHPVAQRLLRVSGLALAAPSANTSGKPSPTTAEHVADDMDGRIEAILDGGACGVGVESTVLTLADGTPRILRPGIITREQIEEVIGDTLVDKAVLSQLESGEKAASPGMKYKHYAPEAEVILLRGDDDKYINYVNRAYRRGMSVAALCYDEDAASILAPCVTMGAMSDEESQAQELFDALRSVDELGVKTVYAHCPSTEGVGMALYNRMIRAAAFRVIDLPSKRIIGLTGQTGAGKGYAGRILGQLGMAVIDTDSLAREAVEIPGVIKRLKEEFGDDIFKDGALDRGELARRAFSCEEKTRALNSITHPEITRLTAERIHTAEQSGAKAAVIDAPVLFESPLTAVCDKIICVTAPESVRIERIMQRDGISREDALTRIGAQRDEEYYKSKSDIVLINDGKTDIKQEILNRKDLI